MNAMDLAVPLVGAAAKKPAATSSAWLIFVVIGAGFYFLIYRPQQRKAKALRETSKNFEVGDEVLTAGGIVGHVIDIDGDRVTLETSVGASFVVLQQYVLRKLEETVPSDDDDEADYEDDDYDINDDDQLDDDQLDDDQEHEEEETASSGATDDDSSPTSEHRTGKGGSSRSNPTLDGVDDNGGPEGPQVT